MKGLRVVLESDDQDMGANDRPCAIRLMQKALDILDREGPHHAAATLSLAIVQAGGSVATPSNAI